MRIFISHGSHDSWVARQIERCIRECGASTFLDINDLETGDAFKARIKDEIKASDELVALLTPFSRRRSWLWNEIGLAWGLGKRIVAITYGMEMSDLDREGEGGRGVLEGYHFRPLNQFDEYLTELKRRVRDGG